MDIKTLEHYEHRAAKGRAIANDIEKLKKEVSEVKGKDFRCLDVRIGSNNHYITEWKQQLVPNDYLAEMEARMLDVYIDSTNAEISRLEKELAEL